MIRRIVEHNKLNGVAFSTIEFLLVAAVGGFIAIAFGLHQRWLGVALVAGTALNCLVVVAVGVAAWRRGERGNALRDVFDAKRREELNRRALDHDEGHADPDNRCARSVRAPDRCRGRA